MDAIVDVLIEKETISGDEFRALLGKYATIPEGNAKAPAAQVGV
jgi:cell division protease FtsH